MCLLLCLPPHESCRTRGHSSGWGDTWGVERSVETEGLFGGTERCSSHTCLISIPWSLPTVRQGEEGVASCLQGASCNAPHLHSTCRHACFTLQL